MNAVAASWSVVGRLGNWSPEFVMPYVKFTDALVSGDVAESQARFDQIITTLSRHGRSELETLINEVLEKEKIDLLDLSAKMRRIVFHHTKSSLFGSGEMNAFVKFAADWCHKQWLVRSEEATAVAEDLSTKEKNLKSKIQTAGVQYSLKK
jgi:hypothetical protein